MTVGDAFTHVLLLSRTGEISFPVRDELTGGPRQYCRSHTIPLGVHGINPWFPENTMTIVYERDFGWIDVFEVGIFRQGNQWFGMTRLDFAAQCFSDGPTVACPYLQSGERQWDGLLDTLDGLLPVPDLPPLSVYKGVLLKPSLIPAGEGIVRWFTPAWGFGHVDTADGTMRVCWDAIPPIEGSRLRFLSPGQRVRITKQHPLEGTRFQGEVEVGF